MVMMLTHKKKKTKNRPNIETMELCPKCKFESYTVIYCPETGEELGGCELCNETHYIEPYNTDFCRITGKYQPITLVEAEEMECTP